MFDPNAYDVEPRRKFKGPETAQFIITMLMLLFSGKLIYDGPKCDKWQTWNNVIFYGSLIWMVYLVVTLVVQFRNEGMKLFFSALDYIFLAFLAVMWIWNYVLIKDKENLKGCAPRWDLHTQIFWYMGWCILIAIICRILMGLIRVINSKNDPHKQENSIHQSHHHGDYDILDQSAI